MADAGNTEKPFVTTIDRPTDPKFRDRFEVNPLRSNKLEVRKEAFDAQTQMTPQPTGGAIDALNEARATGNEEYIKEVNAQVEQSVIDNPDTKYTNLEVVMPPAPSPKVEEVHKESTTVVEQKPVEAPKSIFGKLITALKFR